eukprot:6947448-Pyramimonas_sp.AAC.1
MLHYIHCPVLWRLVCHPDPPPVCPSARSGSMVTLRPRSLRELCGLIAYIILSAPPPLSALSTVKRL